MLTCCSLAASKAEYCRDYEEAAASTTNTHSLDDLLKQNRVKTVAPAATYMDLKLNIGTYCGLLWTIFGDHCDYYKELLKIYGILDCKECFTIWHANTKEVCACITWAIEDDGRSFLGHNPVASDFSAGLIFLFFVSYLEGIMDAARNANPIQQATFPRKWLSLSTLDLRATGGHTSNPLGKPAYYNGLGPGCSSAPGTFHPQGGHATCKNQISYGSVP